MSNPPFQTRAIERIPGGSPLPAHLRGAVIALGNFDGFHRGHQAVVAHAVEMARARGVAAIVATFDPHPVRHFRADALPFRLSTLDQRQRLFAGAGVDAMMVFEFNGALAGVTPEEFVCRWLDGTGGVVTGDRFTFGRNRAGNVDVLAKLAHAQGLAYTAVKAIHEEGEIASSSGVRAALKSGDCVAAARILSRPFTIEGILRGDEATDAALPLHVANLGLGDFLRPRSGVYAVRGKLADGRILGGSAYLAGSPDASLRLFLVDLAKNDIGQHIDIQLIAHLHDAQQVYDRPALRQRIVLDRSEGRKIVFGG